MWHGMCTAVLQGLRVHVCDSHTYHVMCMWCGQVCLRTTWRWCRKPEDRAEQLWIRSRLLTLY